MKKIILSITLCMMFTASACTAVSDIDMSDASEVHTEIRIDEEGESNQNTIEDISNDKSENVFEEEYYGEISEELVEEQSLWEQMVTCEKLSEDDRQSLQRFYPIFCENKEIHLFLSAEEDMGIITLNEVGKPMYGEENCRINNLEKFVFVDMSDDGKDELIIYSRDLGEVFLVLFEEEGEYYCSFHPYRHFTRLQTNGLYVGNGARAYLYYRMRFEDGIWEDTLASEEWNYDEDGNVIYYGVIDEKIVSESEFRLWEEDNLTEEVEWIYVN